MSYRLSAVVAAAVLAGVTTGGYVAASPMESHSPIEAAPDAVDHPAGDQLAVWSDIVPGARALPTITIDDSIYPDDAGVQFSIDGEIDERSASARPNGHDATGPQDDSRFHIYPHLDLRHGMKLEATWTDRNGQSHVSAHVVGVDVQPNDPAVPATAPLAPAGTTQWSDVDPGQNQLPTITIDRSIYPNDHGVQLYFNGQVDARRPSARPDGWDATGPSDSSRFHIYPAIDLASGDRVEARWSVPDGSSFRSVYVVGQGEVRDDATSPEATTTTSTTAAATTSTTAAPTTSTTAAPTTSTTTSTAAPTTSTTAAPTTTTTPTSPTPPAATGNWPDAATTGHDDRLTRSYGSVTITEGWLDSNNGGSRVLEDVSFSGGVTVEVDNLTIRNFRIEGGRYGVDNGVFSGNPTTGLVLEDGEITGQSSSGLLVSNTDARRLHIHHQAADAIKPFENVTVEDSYIHHLGSKSGSHSDGIQMVSGGDVTVRGNNFEMPSTEPGYTNSQVFMIAPKNGAISNLAIEGNRINGGSISVQVHNVSNASVTDNQFGRDYQFGLFSLTGPVQRSGNVWEDTSAPV